MEQTKFFAGFTQTQPSFCASNFKIFMKVFLLHRAVPSIWETNGKKLGYTFTTHVSLSSSVSIECSKTVILHWYGKYGMLKIPYHIPYS